jgi:hypothetical protein
MVDLHPIVIPPLEHTYKSVKYTCSGEGLYKDGFLYDSNAEKLVPPKHEKAGAKPKEKKGVSWWKAQCAFRGLNQSGSIADLQSRLKEAKKKILPELKSIESDLNKTFRKMNHEARGSSWSTLKKPEEKAAANPRRYLLEEFPKSGTGRPANLDIVILKLDRDGHLAVHNAADEMDLEAVSVDAPWTSKKKPSPDRWLIIGRTRDAVWEQMREIERQTSRSKETFAADMTGSQKPSSPKTGSRFATAPKATARARKTEIHMGSIPNLSTLKVARKSAVPDYEHMDKESVKRRKDDARARQLANHAIFDDIGEEDRDVHSRAAKASGFSQPTTGLSYTARSTTSRTKQTARKRAYPDSDDDTEEQGDLEPSSSAKHPSDNSWDVRGAWEISCPNIADQWPSYGDDSPLTMDTYLGIKNGRQQLYAEFDFGIFGGIMRFEKPVPVSKSASAAGPSKKRKREDSDEEGDVEVEYDPSYDEKVFLLGSKDKPTARRPTWRYRWRGRETGTGEIQLGSDNYVQEITFSDKGNELSGTIRASFAGVCRFTGIKVQSSPQDNLVDPQSEWQGHNEQAYEEANRSRWH